MSVTPIRFCARHDEEMIDPGERACLGAEMSPCEGPEREYVIADQLLREIVAEVRARPRSRGGRDEAEQIGMLVLVRIAMSSSRDDDGSGAV